MANAPTFLNIATELQLAIISYLPLRSKFRLKHTNHYFYDIIPTLTHVELLALEQTFVEKRRFREDPRLVLDSAFLAQYLTIMETEHGYLACKDCLCLRPHDNFVSYGKYQSETTSRSSDRFCLECGVKNGSKDFVRGAFIKYKGEKRVLCMDCEEFPAAEGAHERRVVSQCRACFGLRGPTLDEKMVRKIGGASSMLHHGLECIRCDKGFKKCHNSMKDVIARRPGPCTPAVGSGEVASDVTDSGDGITGNTD